MQLYNTVASRNTFRAEAVMLKHAVNRQVMAKFGDAKTQPLNKTDTIIWRRVLPYGAVQAANPALGNSAVPNVVPQDFLIPEGSVPSAKTIDYQNVSATLQYYFHLMKFSNKAELLYEDNIPDDMSEQTGEILGDLTEKIVYGTNRGGISVLYANGSSRAAVNTPISMTKLASATRALSSNLAPRVTKMIGPGPNFNTTAVQPGWIAFAHTDLEYDISLLPNFRRREDYGGSYTALDDSEFGSVGRYRFLLSPMFDPFLAQGSGTLNGMKSVGGSNVDVYPILLMGQDAWGTVKLAGKGSIAPTIISSQTLSHANPARSFGYVGGGMWFTAVRLNENRCVRIEVAATDI